MDSILYCLGILDFDILRRCDFVLTPLEKGFEYFVDRKKRIGDEKASFFKEQCLCSKVRSRD